MSHNKLVNKDVNPTKLIQLNFPMPLEEEHVLTIQQAIDLAP